MDIQRKKNKVIDLRKKKITSVKPIKIPITIAPVTQPVITQIIAPFQGGTFPCVDCKDVSAQELGRCRSCDAKHRQLTAQLDARPKMQEPIKAAPTLNYRKEVSSGVVVTVSTSEPLRL